jgi:hypothetical protein
MFALKNRQRLIQLWQHTNLSYNAEDKKIAHDLTRKLLRHFARNTLQLENSEFTVRSNMAGIACGGEVILHTNPFHGGKFGLYIQVSDSTCGSVLYRTTKHLADYTGGPNQWTNVDDVFGTQGDEDLFANKCSNLCGCPCLSAVYEQNIKNGN